MANAQRLPPGSGPRMRGAAEWFGGDARRHPLTKPTLQMTAWADSISHPSEGLPEAASKLIVGGTGRHEPPDSDGELADEFEELARRWKEETALLSSVSSKVLHPAYQRIIGLGPPAVPHILKRLRQGPDHWFWALTAITGIDPAKGRETLGEATEAWLEWGRLHGYDE